MERISEMFYVGDEIVQLTKINKNKVMRRGDSGRHPHNKPISLSLLPFVLLPTSHSSVALSSSSLQAHRTQLWNDCEI